MTADDSGRLPFDAYQRDRYPGRTPMLFEHPAVGDASRKAWAAARRACEASVRQEMAKLSEALEITVDALQHVALSGDEKLRALVLEALANAERARR